MRHRPTPRGFIDEVVRTRDLVVTHASGPSFRLEPRESPFPWHCDLVDEYSEFDDDNMVSGAAHVRWVCPSLRKVRTATATEGPELDVHRTGPHSDLGKLVARFGRLLGKPSGGEAGPGTEGRYVYTDPHGVIDAPLRQRLENWPKATGGDRVVRPAELWDIHFTAEGLIVSSSGWWDSAPALDHHIGLAVDIATRLRDTPRSAQPRTWHQ